MSGRRLAELVEALRGEIALDIDGVIYRLPPRSALDWATALLDDAPDAIVPGLFAPADATAVYDRLLDDYDDLDLSVVEEAGLWLVEQVAQRPWWEVRRAVLTALDSWSAFDAWCAHECNGLDPATLPLARFCNLTVRFITLHLPEDARESWLAGFATPPAEADLAARPEWQEQAMAADTDAAADQWAALAGSVGSASPD